MSNCNSQLVQELFDAVDRKCAHAVRHLVCNRGVAVDVLRPDIHNGETCLHRACFQDDSSMVRLLLELGADKNTLNSYGESPLAIAMWNRSVEVVRELVVVDGAEVKVEGLTHVALIDLMEHKELLRILLQASEKFRHKYECALFLEAARNGILETVEWCLGFGVDPNALYESDKTALHFAAYNDHVYMAQALICAGAHLDVKDSRGRTPLVTACERRNKNVLEILLENGADTEAHPNFPNRTPLEQAIEDNMIDIARLLLEKTNGFSHPRALKMLQQAMLAGDYETARRLHKAGVDVGARFKYGKTALHYACYQGHEFMVHYLLGARVNVNAADDGGDTPLFVATRESTHGNTPIAIIQELLQAGADVNIHCGTDSFTPLIEATRQWSFAICYILLENGARVDDSDQFGRTALHHAAELGSVPIATLLLRMDASVDAMDQFGRTALMVASSKGYTNLARELLNAGANPLLECTEGRTALFIASWEGQVDTLRLLLGTNVPINATDNDGCTPLHGACSQGDLDVCRLLVERKASLHAMDVFGRTALHCACSGGNCDVVNMLLRAGARVRTCQADGMTPFHTACEEGFVDIVEALLGVADPRAVDKEHLTPMYYASRAGHWKVVKHLLRFASNLDIACSLCVASERRHHNATFLLVAEMHLRQGG
eukprot:scaffold75_cov165-Amphora_coffeaeformis.AAC.2